MRVPTCHLLPGRANLVEGTLVRRFESRLVIEKKRSRVTSGSIRGPEHANTPFRGPAPVNALGRMALDRCRKRPMEQAAPVLDEVTRPSAVDLKTRHCWFARLNSVATVGTSMVIGKCCLRTQACGWLAVDQPPCSISRSENLPGGSAGRLSAQQRQEKADDSPRWSHVLKTDSGR